MARPRLESVKLLANHGARVTYRSTAVLSCRFERPNGRLTVPEAAALLRTNRMRVLRMGAAGKLRLGPGRDRRVKLADVRDLLAMPAAERAKAMATGGPR